MAGWKLSVASSVRAKSRNEPSSRLREAHGLLAGWKDVIRTSSSWLGVGALGEPHGRRWASPSHSTLSYPPATRLIGLSLPHAGRRPAQMLTREANLRSLRFGMASGLVWSAVDLQMLWNGHLKLHVLGPAQLSLTVAHARASRQLVAAEALVATRADGWREVVLELMSASLQCAAVANANQEVVNGAATSSQKKRT